MKKVLILTCALMVLTPLVSQANEQTTPNEGIMRPRMENYRVLDKNEFEKIKQRNEMRNRETAFEKKLGLTEEQKAKAKELRKKGHEEMRPLMQALKQKREEVKAVKLSRIAPQAQEEKLAVLDKEIQDLEKKINALKKKNMKDFEAILTRDQRKILKQMKKEGRHNYSQYHNSVIHTLRTGQAQQKK